MASNTAPIFGSDIAPHLRKIIDNFAGGGGASEGIRQALGRSPDYALNHSKPALALHEVNHPETIHLSENIYKVDPLDHLAGEHIGLGWFSPDCKHFSKAKGGKPVERNIRDLAWTIVHWVERIQKSGGKIDVIIMENVEEFQYWGPLVETERGLMPDPERKGETFQKWCKELRKLGGKIQKRELRACDYGAPTIRKRLFVIVRFDGLKIVWPKPTHGAPIDSDVIAGRKLPWRTAADIINWSLPCPSIFDTSDEILARYGLRAIRPLAYNTMARVARGMRRYVLDALRPFIVGLAHGYSSGRREYGLSEPLTTVHAGGNNQALVAPSVVRFNTGATGQDAREPLSTVTANGFIKRPGGAAPLGVMAPHLMTMRNAAKPFNGADEPTHTITAGGAGLSLVSPVLSAAFVAQHNNDSRRDGGVNPGRDAREPLSTATATGAQQGVISAFISRQFGTSTGHDAHMPLATTTADGGGKSLLVAPHLHAYYGVDQDTPEDEPIHTLTTKPRFSHIEARIEAPPFTEDQADRARMVADFMRQHGLWDNREFVTVDLDGVTFVIVDIGMRMLTPRELYNAQGFPRNYVIDRDVDGNVFSKSVQVSCVGNSVSPPVAAALVAANCNHMAVPERIAA
ncbi:DNA cytosine methyltransferase [Rhizobium rhizogenes]|uniref:DNA cytosine methyltransferase n=1 Tax=Rhizobium rhizogenes TaxID=359 RepID=UPI0024BD7444|nr:DNA cytosine methyltransferase [Rhizobium rhizogenes]MDJ1632691.1 DNA cytosine methyltransferase [Rhizobium rhizogenes]